jgi:hypothetical protein
MSGRCHSILKGLALTQLSVLAACSAATAIGAGEVEEPNLTTDNAGGSVGSVGVPGSGGLGGGGIQLADDFETPGTWGFYSSTSSGIGYVSSRSDARSPSHVGSQYDRRGTSGYQILFRNFTVPPNTGECVIIAYIKPLTAVTGQLQIIDPANKALLGTKPFQAVAPGDWFGILVSTTAAPSAGALSVRVELDHDGTFQELLVDDVSGSCAQNP